MCHRVYEWMCAHVYSLLGLPPLSELVDGSVHVLNKDMARYIVLVVMLIVMVMVAEV